MGTPVLLTLDEARSAVASSSLRLLRLADAPPEVLARMIWGSLEATECPGSRNRRLFACHRRVLRLVERAGHGDVIDDELDGVCSAAGLPGRGAEREEHVGSLSSAA
jgi:hypothetical protein